MIIVPLSNGVRLIEVAALEFQGDFLKGKSLHKNHQKWCFQVFLAHSIEVDILSGKKKFYFPFLINSFLKKNTIFKKKLFKK